MTGTIELIHKSQNIPIRCPTMLHSEKNVHITVLNGVLWDMEHVHYGISEIHSLTLHISMVYSKNAVSPFPPLRIYCSVALGYRYDLVNLPQNLWSSGTITYHSLVWMWAAVALTPSPPSIYASANGWALVQVRLVAYSAPSHYLNQCSLNVYWTFGNKFQWSFNRNSNIFVQ